MNSEGIFLEKQRKNQKVTHSGETKLDRQTNKQRLF